MKKQVMTKAVAIARTLEGDWIARMKMALKMAWALVKKNTKKTMEEVADMIRNKVYGVQVNVWERYGKRRIYVNKGFKNTVAMLEFDHDDNYIGPKYSDLDAFGARQAGWEEEFVAVKEIIEEIA